MTFGYLSANSDRILQPNLAGGANPSNSHFNDPGPQFSSIVGGVSGCVGAGGRAAAIYGNGNPGYNIEKIPYHHQKGGWASHRRGGKKRQSGNKRSGNKRSGNKRSGNKRSGQKRSNKKRSHRRQKRSNKKRSMRGGLSTLAPASFSGASNLQYNQFTGDQPLSFNFGLGSTTALPPNLIGMASPPPMMKIENNCGPDYGLVSKGLLN